MACNLAWAWLLLTAVLLGLATPGPVRASPSASDDTVEVRYLRERWLDTTRQRHVNVRIALPATPAEAPMPVLLFSSPQGFRWGGHQEQYVPLTREMVRRGVVMVTVSHVDADEPLNAAERFADVYPGVLTGSRNDPSVDRYEDMRFVLAELERRQAQGAAAQPRLDLDRIAVAGHSSGTLTALHVAGMPVRDRQGQVQARPRDPRIRAIVLYSLPLEYRGPSREDLREVGAVAGLHVAGSQDHPQYRNTAYRYLNRAPQHWMVAEGGHNIGASGSEPLVLEVTGAFIDVYLNGRQAQRSRLDAEALGRFGSALQQLRSKPAQRFKALDQRDFVAWARDTLPGGRWLHELGIRQGLQREEPRP